MLHKKKIRSTASALLIALLAGCASAPPPQPPEPAASQPAPEVAEPQPVAEPEPIVVRPDHPREYVVVKGDTLWDIAARFLRDPWLWPEVWQNNPQVENPHLIYPGDILRLVYIDGRPAIQVQRGGVVSTGEPGAPGRIREISPPPPGLETVKLSPRVREEPLDRAVPTIPMDAIKSFLGRSRVVSREQLEDAPYVLTSLDEHLIAGGRGQRLFVRGLDTTEFARYAIVRRGEPYYDPQTDRLLGYEAVFLAEARVLSFGDPATMEIEVSRREVLNGDILLPMDETLIDRTFMPRAPEEKVEGQIIAVVDGVNRVSQYQVVTLNLGMQDDVEAGHVLAVYQAGQEVRDPVTGEDVLLPRQRAGTVMIFRVFDNLSYALVMDATRAIHLYDVVTNP